MTFKNSFKQLATVFVALLATGCTSSPENNSQVHLVGSVTIDTENKITVPVYWQGSTITELSRLDTTCNGYANSVVVSGTDTHIAGTTFLCSADATERTPVAAYWKNGQRTDLERPLANAQTASEAQQVVVANGSVYVAGYVTGANGQTPAYWKDGHLIQLADIPFKGTKARASNIFIEGNDVYVSGAMLFNSAYPAFWKNGVATDLPVPNNYRGTSVPLPIAVSNGDVYVFGHFHRPRTKTQADTGEIPVYWKNGSLVQILASDTEQGYSYGGTAYNGVPYTAGAFVEGLMYKPAVWVDKARLRLPLIDESLYGMAHDVFVDDTGVYAAGWSYKREIPSDPASTVPVPCYWSKGTRVDLPTINGKAAYARELFVTH